MLTLEVQALQQIDPSAGKSTLELYFLLPLTHPYFSSDKEGFKNKLKEILPKYSEADLQQIFINYRDADGKGIDDAVDKVIENKDEKRAYNYYGILDYIFIKIYHYSVVIITLAVRYVESTCKFYADLLYDAVEGGIMKTNVPAINRIVITRCERDLGCILEKYKETHNKSFKDRLNVCFIPSTVIMSSRHLMNFFINFRKTFGQTTTTYQRWDIFAENNGSHSVQQISSTSHK